MKRICNPPNPFLHYSCEWLDVPPAARLEVFEEEAKSILSKNDSPDIPFTYSVNPYRGCFHGCAYCYARPTHQYLDFGAGSDFERKIVVKINAPELLRREFSKRSRKRDMVNFSGVTDCYQPLEGSYELTRRCLEVCREFSNPVSIITKGLLIRRDTALLVELTKRAEVRVFVSIPFSDDLMSKEIEPHAPRPSRRFEVVRELSAAGIHVGVGVSPIIPGLTDNQIVPILEKARECGASSAFYTLLRLPKEVSPVFFQRIDESFPERRAKIEGAIKAMKDGKLNRSEFGKRMSGTGERWKPLEWIFRSTCERLGFSNEERGGSATRFPLSSSAADESPKQLRFAFFAGKDGTSS